MYRQVTMTTSPQMPPNERSAQRPQVSPNAWMGRLLAAGSVLAGLTILGVGSGYFMDEKAGTTHRWVLILGVAGIGLGLYQVVRAMRGP